MSSAVGIEEKATTLSIGVNDAAEVAVALPRCWLTHSRYLRTYNFQWDVVGPMFHSLHLMFEEQYNELWLTVDAISERIRGLSYSAPGSYRAFSELTYVQDSERYPVPPR